VTLLILNAAVAIMLVLRRRRGEALS
jgi:hypothetical protein